MIDDIGVPSIVAKAVTEAVNIPVIGIGAGPYTSGNNDDDNIDDDDDDDDDDDGGGGGV